MKRLIAMHIVESLADSTGDASPASTSINIARRAGRVGGTKADRASVPGRMPDGSADGRWIVPEVVK